MLRVNVAYMAAYNAFYRKLISNVELEDVSSGFSLEQIKSTTTLPLAIESANGDANAR